MNNELTLEQLRFARDIGATHRYDDLFWKSALDVKVVAWSNIGEVWKVRDAGIDNSNSAWDEYKINFAPLDEAEQEKSHPKNERGTGMKYDSGKPRMGLLPPLAITEMAKVMTFGANKYQAHSWKQVENAQERYLDALLRHAIAYVAGERIDPESGLPTMAHIMCDAAFLIELDMDITHWMPLPTPPESEK